MRAIFLVKCVIPRRPFSCCRATITADPAMNPRRIAFDRKSMINPSLQSFHTFPLAVIFSDQSISLILIIHLNVLSLSSYKGEKESAEKEMMTLELQGLLERSQQKMLKLRLIEERDQVVQWEKLPL